MTLYRISLKVNYRWLNLQLIHAHRAWQADWHQVVFSDESYFNLWDHDDHVRFRRYTGQRCFTERVIERHRGRTSGIIVWDAISYHGWSNLLRIEGNHNNKRDVREVLKPEKPPLKVSLEQSFNRIMHTHILQGLFETSVQPNIGNFFFSLLIHWICRLSAPVGFGAWASRS